MEKRASGEVCVGESAAAVHSEQLVFLGKRATAARRSVTEMRRERQQARTERKEGELRKREVR